DFSAWYHIVVAFDTTQETASNRMKLYVNGVQVTAFDTANYPTQNTDYGVNQTAYPFYIGSEHVRRFYGGYMADVYFVDGQALAPTSFAETDSTYGHWKPKLWSGTFGTNGFHLRFEETGTGTASSTTIGADSSGNDNHWTSNGLSADDVMSQGASGHATYGNTFCTMNAACSEADTGYAVTKLRVIYKLLYQTMLLSWGGCLLVRGSGM
ncbi:MAG: hypothetical protein QF704_14320, partial [Anaerolineales bacterium]|nr:hypothetical protein [Anaerolineales bacterium]